MTLVQPVLFLNPIKDTSIPSGVLAKSLEFNTELLTIKNVETPLFLTIVSVFNSDSSGHPTNPRRRVQDTFVKNKEAKFNAKMKKFLFFFSEGWDLSRGNDLKLMNYVMLWKVNTMFLWDLTCHRIPRESGRTCLDCQQELKRQCIF